MVSGHSISTHPLCVFCPWMGCTSAITCPALPHASQALAALSLAYPLGLWDASHCGGTTQLVPTDQCLSSSSLFPRGVSSDPCFWVGKLTWVTSYAGFSGLGGMEQYPVHVLELRALQSTCSPFPYHSRDLHNQTGTGQFKHWAGWCRPPRPPVSARRWLRRQCTERVRLLAVRLSLPGKQTSWADFVSGSQKRTAMIF